MNTRSNQRSGLYRCAVACVCALLLTGCVPSLFSGSHELSMVSLHASGALERPGAEPRLPLVKLRLGSGTLVAEIARTPMQTATGLTFRSALAWGSAMLFVYPIPHRASFYMKNTSIPLSGAYIDANGVILEIHDLHPGDETPVVSRTDNVQFVLEVNRTWFEKNGVTTGSRIYVER